MCFELDSEPPIPRIAGAAVSHEDLELESADGNRFAAFLATPDEPSETGIVILPDVRGLYRFYGRPGVVIPRVGEISAPILALQAGADEGITADDNAAFERALQEAGVDY